MCIRAHGVNQTEQKNVQLEFTPFSFIQLMINVLRIFL